MGIGIKDNGQNFFLGPVTEAFTPPPSQQNISANKKTLSP
jgi:hypothetical protein